MYRYNFTFACKHFCGPPLSYYPLMKNTPTHHFHDLV